MIDRSVASLISRTAEYRYARRTLRFELSQALFSSAGVDSGTHMLLQLIGRSAGLPRICEVVDVGCGTGTLGVALAAACTCRLHATDRDALAVEFTRRNAAANDVEASVAVELGVPVLGPGTRLWACNVPAKAGPPVVRSLLTDLLAAAANGSSAAIVIVRPLEKELGEALRSAGAETIAAARGANHAAVVCRVPDPASGAGIPAPPPHSGAAFPGCYARNRAEFRGPSGPYEHHTVYGLPEFDGLTFRTALAFDLLRGLALRGVVLVYGNGQGHLARGVAQRLDSGRLLLADRDLLALRTTSHNLPGADVVDPVPLPAAMATRVEAATVDWLVLNDDPIPGSIWNEDVIDLGSGLLSSSGRLLVASRTTSIARLLKASGGRLKVTDERRMHGYCASLLRLRRDGR